MWSISRKSITSRSISSRRRDSSARGGASVPHRAERAGAQAVVAAELDVVEHGQAAEQRDVLEGAREAEARRARAPGTRLMSAPSKRIAPRSGR